MSGRRHMGGQSLSQTTIGRRWLPCLTTHHRPVYNTFTTIHLHPVSSQQQINLPSVFSLTFRKPTLICPVQNSIHFQHLYDPNSISTAYHFTINSSPGKRTSSVFWFLLNGLRDRNPRHWNSGQRRVDMQGVCHSGRQASSLR